MLHRICSIYDKATRAYMRPFTAQAQGQAVRMFEDHVRQPDSELGRHPEDYALFEIATFDDNSGEITPCEPFVLRRAHEVEQK